MARIPQRIGAAAPWWARLSYFIARRLTGLLPTPVTVKAHHFWIFWADSLYELALMRSRRVEDRLKSLGGVYTAMLIGCPF